MASAICASHRPSAVRDSSSVSTQHATVFRPRHTLIEVFAWVVSSRLCSRQGNMYGQEVQPPKSLAEPAVLVTHDMSGSARGKTPDRHIYFSAPCHATRRQHDRDGCPSTGQEEHTSRMRRHLAVCTWHLMLAMEPTSWLKSASTLMPSARIAFWHCWLHFIIVSRTCSITFGSTPSPACKNQPSEVLQLSTCVEAVST